MFRQITSIMALWLLVGGCDPEDTATSVNEAFEAESALAAQNLSEGLIRKEIPAEDPGPPFYARVTSILNQMFHSNGWLAVPFYRDPSCIPSDFNLLAFFHFPGSDGPGAFGCPLLAGGFLLIEPDAPLGTFPRQVVLNRGAVPFWFVPWSQFAAEAQDGVVTLEELEALGGMKGVASSYQESLRPREGEHLIVINARGTLDDGRTFQFGVTHIQDQTKAVQIRFR